MSKILGLDLGTNSIGWAIVQKEDSGYILLDKGVNIFKDGVEHDQTGEHPAVQTRTKARASRRHYFRRRLRKIDVLKILIKNKLCPYLPDEALAEWKQHKHYPLDDAFMQWLRTDEASDKNPYHDRFRCLTEVLDFSIEKDRYVFGRAMYHVAQRRGFQSNRKDSTKESEGAVKSGIDELSKDMEASGCKYLGEYFYKLYKNGGKIRKTYTSRVSHYKVEFEAICKNQNIPLDLKASLERAIFYQRPLKSQKGLVGKCTFEKAKRRCPVSHPRYEEFRMLSFINNIKIQSPSDENLRTLNDGEKAIIKPLFLRKSKKQFDFEDIAKKIAGKGNYAYAGDKEHSQFPYKFNYRMSTSVAGCPVTAGLVSVFGNDWLSTICSVYTMARGKSEDQMLNDVWHAMFNFDDDKRLFQWSKDKLQLDDAMAEEFIKIYIPSDYAALSIKAINKILPFLRQGLRYDEAVFLANLGDVLPEEITSNESNLREAQQRVVSVVADFKDSPLNKSKTKVQCIADMLITNYGVSYARSAKLYHPSMIETYQTALPNEEGIFTLGSPRTSSVRNPMAMRALFRMRALINTLLKEQKIDNSTIVNIEFARGLNDSNMRRAIELYQRDREKRRKEYSEKIKEYYPADTEPSEIDILKYELWEEQNHKCLYTGNEISIGDFLGPDSKYDIEHTIPRSKGGPDSLVNKTLCENKFNREIKRAQLPSQLLDHDAILARIEPWRGIIKDLNVKIDKTHRASSTKAEKDANIQRRHRLRFEMNYWRDKYETFTMTTVPEGFTNRQSVDIGIIGRYARLYLKTVFPRVFTVKGATTAFFRKAWGLQNEYEKKERVNHTHHCIDAITIACINKDEYEQWAHYQRRYDNYKFEHGEKPSFEKPWPTFTEDVKSVSDSLIVPHYIPNNMGKQSKKKLRIRGKIQFNEEGKPKYAQGDTARGSLHLQTFYGAIENEGTIKYVVRKSVADLKDEEINRIVDDTVRAKVTDAISKHGGLKQAVAAGIWMNQDKGIPINKVRVFCPNIAFPPKLKEQRDKSKFAHKRNYYVSNDGNYCMAIYEQIGAKKKPKRSFLVISNLEASKFFNKKDGEKNFLPEIDQNGFTLKCILKFGTMVLFYENDKKELFDCSMQELSNRLYVVKGLSTLRIRKGARTYQYGTITLKHSREARPDSEIRSKNGAWQKGDNRPIITVCHSYGQFMAAVEGKDFIISNTGKITFNDY